MRVKYSSKKILEQIKAFMLKTLEEKLPDVSLTDLIENGAIYYTNGNNGTSFDWVGNGHTPRFRMYYKDSEMGCIIVDITQLGELGGYFFTKDNIWHGVDIPYQPFISEEDALKFKNYLIRSRDNRDIYDEIIMTNY